MKPVFQTVFSNPENTTYGNCFAACVASILELDLADVPELSAGDHTDTNARWLRTLNDWLRTKDMAYLEIGSLPPDDYAYLNISTYHIVVGPSPRGSYNHAVVGLNGKIVHDPHPDGSGLLDGAWLHGLFLKISSPST